MLVLLNFFRATRASGKVKLCMYMVKKRRDWGGRGKSQLRRREERQIARSKTLSQPLIFSLFGLPPSRSSRSAMSPAPPSLVLSINCDSKDKQETGCNLVFPSLLRWGSFVVTHSFLRDNKRTPTDVCGEAKYFLDVFSILVHVSNN